MLTIVSVFVLCPSKQELKCFNYWKWVNANISLQARWFAVMELDFVYEVAKVSWFAEIHTHTHLAYSIFELTFGYVYSLSS